MCLGLAGMYVWVPCACLMSEARKGLCSPWGWSYTLLSLEELPVFLIFTPQPPLWDRVSLYKTSLVLNLWWVSCLSLFELCVCRWVCRWRLEFDLRNLPWFLFHLFLWGRVFCQIHQSWLTSQLALGILDLTFLDWITGSLPQSPAIYVGIGDQNLILLVNTASVLTAEPPHLPSPYSSILNDERSLSFVLTHLRLYSQAPQWVRKQS